MKTLRPRVKIYFVSLTVLTTLFLVSCIPLFLSGYLSTTQMLTIIVTALISHLVASLPFPPRLFSRAIKNTKPTPSPEKNNAACTLYVGNLLYRTKREDLVDIFSKFGVVISARIILDKESRKSKGYGFVEMSQHDATSAATALNGSEFNGRALRVNEAKGR